MSLVTFERREHVAVITLNRPEARNAINPEMARAIVARNPQLKWADTSRRGYATLHLTPQRATAEWLFLRTIRERRTALAGRHVMTSARGTNRFG